jgi:hypothetical protein
VFSQLPKELAERRRQLVPHYKAAKEKNMKVNWAGEKLYVNYSIIVVKRDTVRDVNLDTVQKATSMRVRRTPPKSYIL